MATNRKLVFATSEIYHVFNRGVDKRVVFTSKRDYQHAIDSINYYQFATVPFRFSQYLLLQVEERSRMFTQIIHNAKKEVSILAYCLMPNHFHLILKQERDQGISRFVANFSNSYTKYFNARHDRNGALFQGPFKATHPDTDEEVIHLTRYLHLNPVTAYLIDPTKLENYPWSSFPEYMSLTDKQICDTSFVKSIFSTAEKYKQFVLDQVDYAKELAQINHLTINE